MTQILEDYVKKLVKVRTTEKDDGNELNYVGRITFYDDNLIELSPGVKIGKLVDTGVCVSLIKNYEARKAKEPSSMSLYQGAIGTGKVLINRRVFASIEELVEDEIKKD